MENLYDYIKNNSTLEHQVYELLNKCCHDDETVAKGHAQKRLGNINHEFDFYLPKGIKKLDYPNETCVEVKFRLNSRSIHYILEELNRSILKKLVIVYFEGIIPIRYVGQFPNIEFLHISKLQEKANQISSQQIKNIKLNSNYDSAIIAKEKLADAVKKIDCPYSLVLV